MKIEEISKGLYKIDKQSSFDQRGSFSKLFMADWIPFEVPGFKESYITQSNKNVLRGMHFQVKPMEHWKLITLLKGEIIDVVVDIRKGNSFGEVFSFSLNEESRYSILIAPGFAHGFLSLSDDTNLLYNVTTSYSKEHDKGVLWKSINFDWPVNHPIISERDKEHYSIDNYINEFET